MAIRRLSRTLTLTAALAVGLLAAGCDSDEGEVTPDAVIDTSVDTTPDGTGDDTPFEDVEPDAPGDAGPDADEDTVEDAGPDVGEDTAEDVGEDTVEDAGVDAIADADEDTLEDVELDTVDDVEADVDLDTLEDTTTDVGGDVDEDTADVTPDGGGAEPLVLEPALVAGLCESLCGDIFTECEGFTGLGGSEEACEAACLAEVGDDGWWVGSYACTAETCDAAPCFGDAPIGANAACDAACAALDACDLTSLIDLPEDEPDVCRAVCSGIPAAEPAVEPMIACIGETAPIACDEEAIGACFEDGEAICSNLCGVIFNDTDSSLYCEPGADLYDTWPDEEACVDACVPFADAGEPLVLVGCLSVNACGDPTTCMGIDPTVAPACDVTCTALSGLCGGTIGDELDAETCAGFCTGATSGLGFPGAEAADAETCAAALDTCPPEDDVFGALYACAFGTPALCTDTCGAFETCGFLGTGEMPTLEECVESCRMDTLQQSGAFVGVEACVDGAAGECEAIEACAP